MATLRERWPELRGALLCLHVLAILTLALPPPSAVANARAYKSDNAQEEFRQWSARLRRMGIDVTASELEARVFDVGRRYAGLHREVTVPMQAYGSAFGTRQGWQMFASPQRHPAEVHVDIHERGEWTPLFRPRSDEHGWRRRQLEHNRLRKLQGRFARTFYEEHYRGFASWLAELALSDYPDADEVRVRLYRYRSLPPERVRRGEEPVGRYEHELRFERGVDR
jgi:hypothetical protein